MSKLVVRSFGVSVDGYGAGADQDLEHPLGVGGPELMEWFSHSQFWRQMHKQAMSQGSAKREAKSLR